MNPTIELIYSLLVTYGFCGCLLSCMLMMLADGLSPESKVAEAIHLYTVSVLLSLVAMVPVLMIGALVEVIS
jgi:hypothetical protein